MGPLCLVLCGGSSVYTRAALSDRFLTHTVSYQVDWHHQSGHWCHLWWNDHEVKLDGLFRPLFAPMLAV